MKKTILLVEDDYLDVENIKRTFKKLNLDNDLHVAHNGVDALALLTQENKKIVPDIIILDINMPKMNGLEFLGIIKSYYSLKNLRTYMLTTSSEQYDKIAAENLGVSGYIIKPLSVKDRFFQDNFEINGAD